MEARTTATTLTAKLLILNPGEYDLWLMRIEQYFLMIDYSFWKVIKNGNKVLTKTIGTVEQPYEPTTVEGKLDRKNEMKARGTLLMALLNMDQLKFHLYQDANLLMEAIEKRYGENKKSKKLLRSLPSEWKTHALIWRNKAEIETISLDDLYNNLKIYEPKRTGSSSISQNPQNVPFISSNSTSSTNKADNIVYEVNIAHTQGLQSVEEILVHYKKNEVVFTEKINILNLEVKLRDNALDVYTKNLEKAKKEIDELKLTLEKYQNSSKSLNTLLESQVSNKDKTRLGYKAVSLAIENFVNSSRMIKNQENVRSRSDKGYHAVPSSYTWNYIPSKPDLMFIDKQVKSESVDVVSNVTSSVAKTVESKAEFVDVNNKGVYNTVKTKPVKKNSFSPPIIEDWNSDDESKVEFEPKVEVKPVRPCIKKIKFIKTVREKEENVETPKQHKHYPRGNKRN
nr:hypothetical protein [Tanacetum cinerariifolium]